MVVQIDLAFAVLLEDQDAVDAPILQGIEGFLVEFLALELAARDLPASQERLFGVGFRSAAAHQGKGERQDNGDEYKGRFLDGRDFHGVPPCGRSPSNDKGRGAIPAALVVQADVSAGSVPVAYGMRAL